MSTELPPRCEYAVPRDQYLAPAIRGVFRNAGGDELVGASDPDVRLDHRARACLGSGSKGGQEGQALGRSRGGFTTKIHAKSDASGGIIAFDLTGGEASDARHFETLLDIGPDVKPRVALGDKGYSSKANRDGGAQARHCAGNPAQGERKETSLHSSPRRSIRRARASSRASDGSNASNASRCAAKRPNATSDQSSVSPQAYA